MAEEQFSDETVILKIGDRRRRFLVIAPIMCGDFLAKLGDTLGGSRGHGRVELFCRLVKNWAAYWRR